MTREKLESFFEEISIENIQKHLNYLCRFEKLSGTTDAERFTEYASNYLRIEKIPFEILRFPAFLSDPVSASLTVETGDGPRAFPCRTRSFSVSCPEGVRGQLFYDPSNLEEGMTMLEKVNIRKQMRGKIVVSHGFNELYARLAERSGALAWIQVWKSGETEIHEDTVSTVWGTPDLDSGLRRLTLPVIAVDAATGEELIRLCAENDPARAAEAFLTCVVDEGVREVSLPVAHIRGESKDYVLLSSHYDSWYYGAHDNTCANAVLLELARIFYRHKSDIRRSLRIAWWPGYSNGRCMGSTWYCDHYFDDLTEHCMVSMNSNLIGARGSGTVFVRTTGLEGKSFVLETAEAAVPGAEIIFERIGRVSDQSFFGCDIPYHLNPRLETPPGERDTAAPGGHVFWHTKYDTIDKLDPEVIRKDARLLGGLLYRFLTEELLPVDLRSFFGELGKLVTGLRGRNEDQEVDAVLKEILQELAEVWELWEDLILDHYDDTGFRNNAAKDVGGTICRLIQSSSSPYDQDTAFRYGPMRLLGESCQADHRTWPEDLFLFSRTTLIRQRNRYVTELRKLRRRLAAEYL